MSLGNLSECLEPSDPLENDPAFKQNKLPGPSRQPFLAVEFNGPAASLEYINRFKSKRVNKAVLPFPEFLKTKHHVYPPNNSNDPESDLLLPDKDYLKYIENEAISRDLIYKRVKKIKLCSELSYTQLIDTFSKNRMTRDLIINSKIPENTHSQAKIGSSKLNKTSWDLVLKAVSSRYNDIADLKKQKTNLFKKVKRKLESNPIFAKSKPLVSLQHLSEKLYAKKNSKLDPTHKLARTVGKLVLEKWNYINSVLEAQRVIEQREKQIQESEKRLIKILSHSTDILTKPKASASSSVYSSENEASTHDLNLSADLFKRGKLPDYFRYSSDELSSENEEELQENEIQTRTLVEIDGIHTESLDSHSSLPPTLPNQNLDFTDLHSSNPHLLKVKVEDDFASSSESAFASKSSLLRNELRYYQKEGLEWLVKQHDQGRNSILADEMGLGKTIQTIALLDYLALNQGSWGPHLIVVPTSVLLNWEQEFKKWLPGFKVLVLYGSAKQRKLKRAGWSHKNAFHVCITSYQLVLQDIHVFKRRPWSYLILDEAQNIKNFQSKRWQTLMQIKSDHRLLITGTPLQNNLSELWSLIYFLLPQSSHGDNLSAFSDLEEFQAWFARPLDSLVGLQFDSNKLVSEKVSVPTLNDLETKMNGFSSESTRVVHRLHTVLRPYILRRLKSAVEAQMPTKTELIVYCGMSTRQKYLYHEFISRTKTKESLQSGKYLEVMSTLTQLRKVCNHPDLFEPRQIVTPWAMPNAITTSFEYSRAYKVVLKMLNEPNSNIKKISLLSFRSKAEECATLPRITTFRLKHSIHAARSAKMLDISHYILGQALYSNYNIYKQFSSDLVQENGNLIETDVLLNWNAQCHYEKFEKTSRIYRLSSTNFYRSQNYASALCSSELLNAVSISPKNVFLDAENALLNKPRMYWNAPWKQLRGLVSNWNSKLEKYSYLFSQYTFLVPKVVTMADTLIESRVVPEQFYASAPEALQQYSKRLQTSFPDKMLLQFDCGKLQQLHQLLNSLIHGNGDRVLIFTQMSKMLDILEQFLAIHNFRYLRLDGSTKVEHRLALTEQFNNNTKYHCFLSSTRAGGLGINLTGANCVVFYDSDWNPSMDAQCQDRCHRIGQTRDVKIYRMITLNSIEENIWQKAMQKRVLDQVVIQDGNFDTNISKKRGLAFNWQDLAETMLHTSQPLEPALHVGVKDRTEEFEELTQTSGLIQDDLADDVALEDALKELNDTDVLDFDENVEDVGAGASKSDSVVAGIGVEPLATDNIPEVKNKDNMDTTVELSETEEVSQPAFITKSEHKNGDGTSNLVQAIKVETKSEMKVELELEAGFASSTENIGHIDDYIVRFLERNLL